MKEQKNTKLNKKQKDNGITWKQAIGIGVAVTAAVGAGIFFGLKKSKKNELLTDVVDYKINNLPIPEGFETAVIQDLWKEGDNILCIAEDISIKDLGKFGEELVKKIPEMKDMDNAMIAPMGFYKFNMDLAGEAAKELFEETHC